MGEKKVKISNSCLIMKKYIPLIVCLPPRRSLLQQCELHGGDTQSY